jgi:protein involved in polysaccharide export with SLBB domain
VTKAGGFTEGAVTKEVHVVRKGSGAMEANMEKFFNSGDTSQNVVLKPGDTVVVDQKVKKDGQKQSITGIVSSVLPLLSLMWSLRN